MAYNPSPLPHPSNITEYFVPNREDWHDHPTLQEVYSVEFWTTLLHWYAIISLPDILQTLVPVFFLGVFLGRGVYPYFPKLLPIIFWITGLLVAAHHVKFIWDSAVIGRTFEIFWDRSYGIGDFTTPERVYIMGPLYLLDYIHMVLTAILFFLLEDIKYLPTVLLGGGFSLSFAVFRAYHTKPQKNLFEAFGWFVWSQLIILHWVPYQGRWVLTGLGEAGRVSTGLLTEESAYSVVQVIVAFFVILPVFFSYIHKKMNFIPAIIFCALFICVWFAHVGFAATLFFALRSLGFFSEPDSDKKKKE